MTGSSPQPLLGPVQRIVLVVAAIFVLVVVMLGMVTIFVLVMIPVMMLVVMSFVLVVVAIMMLMMMSFMLVMVAAFVLMVVAIMMPFFMRMIMSAVIFVMVMMLVVASLSAFFATFFHLHPFLPSFLFGHFTFHDRTFQLLGHFRFFDADPPHPSFFFTHHAFADRSFKLWGKFVFFEFCPGAPCFLFAHFTSHDRLAEFLANILEFILHGFAEIFVVLILFVAFFGDIVEHFHHGSGLLKRQFAFDHTLGKSLFHGFKILCDGETQGECKQGRDRKQDWDQASCRFEGAKGFGEVHGGFLSSWMRHVWWGQNSQSEGVRSEHVLRLQPWSRKDPRQMF